MAEYESISIARRYLTLMRDALGMDATWVTERGDGGQIVIAVDGAGEQFGLAPGEHPDWDDWDGDGRAVAGRLGIGAYASAPVAFADGRPFGMLCGASRDARPSLGDAEGRLIASLAGALGEELTVLDARARTQRDRRDQIQRVVDGTGLRMVAQPIVALDSMRTVGAEALARFDELPARPDRWFADAASLGIGSLLELAAIRRALPFLDEVPDDVYVSVNASPALVRDPGLIALLSDVSAHRVVLEITEHSSVGNYESLREPLAALRATGVRLAVDDAGAGYASFRHILNLHPDIIKLDREMVTGVATDAARQALIQAMAQFARRLGAAVVAEGIETRGELECLLELGVTFGQGYFIARPAPLPLSAFGPATDHAGGVR